ncbi:MAG TPA: hypothetical protein VH593_25170 [Ktedonobacteraceae bacterium]|jgi:hypothetical protein
MSGLSVRAYKRTAQEMLLKGVEEHFRLYDVALYRVVLSTEWKDELQGQTTLDIGDGAQVLVGYRKNQDRYTISCNTTKQGNRKVRNASEREE